MLSSISLNSIELRNGTAPGLGSPQVYLGRKNHHPMFAKRMYLLALMALLGQRAAFPQAAGEGLWPAWDAKLLEDHLQRNSANLEPGFASALAGDSLRMGVVLLNGQCTGTFISSSGLFITNHHCVMEGVAKSDRRGENWIKEGFWAKDRAGERKLENMEACVLLGTKDVTLELKGGDLERRMAALEAEMAGNSGQRVVIKSFDEGQKLIAFTYQHIPRFAFGRHSTRKCGEAGRGGILWEMAHGGGRFRLDPCLFARKGQTQFSHPVSPPPLVPTLAGG
jgi:hypothetical protein